MVLLVSKLLESGFKRHADQYVISMPLLSGNKININNNLSHKINVLFLDFL